MFEFDAGKLIIIGIVALIVIGPKELPRVLRQVGQTVAKLRRMAAEFQGQFMDAMREADLADIKADVTKLTESAKVDTAFNPIATLETELTRAVEAAGTTTDRAGAGASDDVGSPPSDAPRPSILAPSDIEGREPGTHSILSGEVGPGGVEPDNAASLVGKPAWPEAIDVERPPLSAPRQAEVDFVSVPAARAPDKE